MEKNFCIVCGVEIKAPKRMYCSNNCKQKHHYLKIKENPNTFHSQTVRGLRRKIKLIEMKGGGCEICGYNKNLSALEFHHTDPSLKDFNLDSRKLSNTTWNKILEESNKCILLCSNCHKELHNPEYNAEYVKNLNLTSERNEVDHYKKCAYCGKTYDKKNLSIFCSDECKNNSYIEKFSKYPTKEEVNIKYSELKSWEKVANFYGLTRKIITNIRKRKL